MTALEEEKIMDREQDAGGFWGSTFLSDDTVQVLAISMSGWKGRCREKNEGLRRIWRVKEIMVDSNLYRTVLRDIYF